MILASSSDLAGARRRRMHKEPNLEASPLLGEVDPRAALAAEAKVKAAEAHGYVVGHNRYDHSGAPIDADLMQFHYASMPYKGGGKAARRGKYAALLG